MQKEHPDCVLSVQCPFYIVLLITQLLKQCNVKRALARDCSQKQGHQRGWSSSAVNRCSDFIALLYWTASSAIVLSKRLRAALHSVFEKVCRLLLLVCFLCFAGHLRINPNSWDPISIASAVHCVQSSAILLIGFQVLGCTFSQMGKEMLKCVSSNELESHQCLN